MELITNRLVLKPIVESNIDEVHNLHSLPETDEFNTLGIPNSIADTIQIITNWAKEWNLKNEQNSYVFAIYLKEGDTFIGLIAINKAKPKYQSAEIWFKLLSDYWNQGFATEALKVIVNFGFDSMNLHRIEAGCAVANIASMRVLQKVGMIQEGCKRKALPLKSGWSDNYEFGILSSDTRML